MSKQIQIYTSSIGKISGAACCLLLLLLGWSSNIRAEEKFHNALSLQGFTGILNTPNAEVTEEGKGYILYSDQRENDWRAKTKHEDSYMFSVGLFPHVELGGRLTVAPGRKLDDLSGNLKLQMPFLPREGYIPQVAIGFQDFGGNGHLENAYGVISKDIWRFRLSLGYGIGPKRMEGVFGGVEAKAIDWLYLLGEYDTRETNLGLRIVTPDILGYPIKVQATVKTSLDYKPVQPEFGFGLQFPLGFDRKATAPLPATITPEIRPAAKQDTTGAAAASESAVPPPTAKVPTPSEASDVAQKRLRKLQEVLVAEGFQNVRIGRAGSELMIVEYENSLFNHNELDGLGVVLGAALRAAPTDVTMLRFIMKKKGIRMVQLTAPLAAFRAFMIDAGKVTALRESLRITTDVADNENVTYLGEAANTSWLTSSLVLAPGLRTYVGTEVGAFNYLLSLKPELFVNTWKGAVIDARADIPFLWSENYDDGKPFRRDRNDSQIDRLMLFQAVKLSPAIMGNFGAGMVVHNLYGTLNEVMWTPGNGDHRLRLMHLYGEGTGGSARKESYLGTYRYFFAPLDTYLEGAAGKFFTQDRGFTAELKRFFGDTGITVYYKNASAADGKHYQMGGIQFELPLTPRRDMKPRILQVRGTENFAYAQETIITEGKDQNWIGVSVGVKPEPTYSLARTFYNRDRLSDTYIREHLLRLRDAYIEYAVKWDETAPNSP